jgi:uncharacterized phage-like protein YoqJ
MNNRRLMLHLKRKLGRRSLPRLEDDLAYFMHMYTVGGFERAAFEVFHRMQRKHGTVDVIEYIKLLGETIESRKEAERIYSERSYLLALGAVLADAGAVARC